MVFVHRETTKTTFRYPRAVGVGPVCRWAEDWQGQSVVVDGQRADKASPYSFVGRGVGRELTRPVRARGWAEGWQGQSVLVGGQRADQASPCLWVGRGLTRPVRARGWWAEGWPGQSVLGRFSGRADRGGQEGQVEGRWLWRSRPASVDPLRLSSWLTLLQGVDECKGEAARVRAWRECEFSVNCSLFLVT